MFTWPKCGCLFRVGAALSLTGTATTTATTTTTTWTEVSGEARKARTTGGSVSSQPAVAAKEEIRKGRKKGGKIEEEKNQPSWVFFPRDL